MPILSPRLMRALDTAAHAHRHHRRKASGVPYISHLFAVMYLLTQVTDDEDVLIAALLHDTIEDVPEEYSESRMRREFGDRVTGIVLDVTKDDTLPDWQARSDAYLDHLSHGAREEAVLLSCADKLHNLKSTLADHEEIGDALWERFNAGKERQQWWYGAILQVVRARLPHNLLVGEFERLVKELQRL